MELLFLVAPSKTRATHIRVRQYYNKYDHVNPFNGVRYHKGYYLEATPVEYIPDPQYPYYGGLGINIIRCLVETPRTSMKAEAEATAKTAELIVPMVVKVCAANELTLIESK